MVVERTQWRGKWVAAWQWKKHDKWLEDEELHPMLILKERNQWSTPTLFCASDETEEEEEPKGPTRSVRPRRRRRERTLLELQPAEMPPFELLL